METLAHKVEALQAELRRLKQIAPHGLLDNLETGMDDLAASTMLDSRERLRAFADALPDLAFILDEDGRYIDIITDRHHLLYQEASQLTGQLMRDVLPTDIAAGALAVVHKTLETQQSQVMEYEMTVPAGQLWFEGRTAPMQTTADGKRLVVWVARDVTERKRAEDRFSRAFHGSPAGTFITRETDAIVVEVNQSFLDLAGYPREAIIGLRYADLPLWSKTLTGDPHKPQRNQEFEICTQAGDRCTILVSTVPIHFDGEPCFLTQVYDITEKKLSQQQAMALELEQQQSAYLREFINNISHHFSNPLSVINTTLYLLNNVLNSESEVKYIRTLEKQATILSVLVSKLTTISHLDDRSQFMFVRVRINLLIYRMAAKRWKHVTEHGLQLELDINQDVPLVRADPNLLENAMGEIIDNAVYHTAPPGTITVKLYAEPDAIIIRISDTGEGIAPHHLPHIFERFYRADAARTDVIRPGLGLSIAKSIIEAHRGQITAASPPGEGAVFTISLPIEPML